MAPERVERFGADVVLDPFRVFLHDVLGNPQRSQEVDDEIVAPFSVRKMAR
jgi:hypothetical protein